MMTYTLKKPLFPLGRILIAPEIESLEIDIHPFLRRHQTGDFGCVEPYNEEENLEAIKSGEGILSQYQIAVGELQMLLAVMTEADRSYTVVFLIHETEPQSPDAACDENGRGPA